MHDQPAAPGCGDCPARRTCTTLRKLAPRDAGCPTVVDLYEAAEQLHIDPGRLLITE